MNKKELAKIRKEFKLDSFKLRVRDIALVYVQKEKAEVFHQQYGSFSLLEAQQQELFLQNFKKILSGNIDEKLFELKFDRSIPNNAQDLLLEGVTCDPERWEEIVQEIVSRNFLDKQVYKEDMIFTFIRAEFYNAVKKKKNDNEEKSIRENFIFYSMNKTSQPKKALLFDYKSKEFKSNLVLDAMINLTSPLQGFMFPTIQQRGTVDVNHVLYSTNKKNCPDRYFVHKVLNCNSQIDTADNETTYFNQVLIKALEGKTNPKVISEVYYKLNKIVEEEVNAQEDGEIEPVMLDYKDISNILVASGVEKEPDEVKEILKQVVDDESFEFKAENLLTASDIMIDTNPVRISVNAQNLQKLHQIHHEGKLCLLIEIDKNAEINGLMIETETNTEDVKFEEETSLEPL